jgi:hypothetical protein
MIFVKAISKYLAIIGALWMSIPLQGVADEQLVINFAEKFVNHEISVSDLQKFDNNFSATFVDLINWAGFIAYRSLD